MVARSVGAADTAAIAPVNITERTVPCASFALAYAASVEGPEQWVRRLQATERSEIDVSFRSDMV